MHLIIFAFLLASLPFTLLSSKHRRVNSRVVSWSTPLIKESTTDPNLVSSARLPPAARNSSDDEETDTEALEDEIRFLRKQLETNYKEYEALVRQLDEAKQEIVDLENHELKLVEQMGLLKVENSNLANKLRDANLVIKRLSKENYHLSKSTNK